jgi:hypothetical protein
MPWSPQKSTYNETSSKVARNLLLSTPAERLQMRASGGGSTIDGAFNLSADKQGHYAYSKAKPFKKVYNDFPVAVADPNRMRDMGTDFGHALGSTNKYAYRLQSPEMQ